MRVDVSAKKVRVRGGGGLFAWWGGELSFLGLNFILVDL